MDEIKNHKKCSRCGRVLNRERFDRDRNRPDGLYPTCKDCCAEARRLGKQGDPSTARAKARVAMARWRERNPEAAREISRRYEERQRAARAAAKPNVPEGYKICAACRQTVLLNGFCKDKRRPGGVGSYCISCDRIKFAPKMAAYRERNRERNRERIRARLSERRKTESYKTWGREYRNRPHVRAITRDRDRVRVARIRASGDGFTRSAWLSILAAFGGACCYCGEVTKMTLEHLTPLSRGGDNRAGNVACACAPCNFKKRALTAEDFAPDRAAEIRRVATEAHNATTKQAA